MSFGYVYLWHHYELLLSSRHYRGIFIRCSCVLVASGSILEEYAVFQEVSQISPVISTQWSGHTFHLIKNLCYFGDPPVTLNKSLNANHERICSEINHNLHWSSWKPLATWKHVTSQVRVIVLWELFNHFVHTLHRPSWVCHKLNKPQCSG